MHPRAGPPFDPVSSGILGPPPNQPPHQPLHQPPAEFPAESFAPPFAPADFPTDFPADPYAPREPIPLQMQIPMQMQMPIPMQMPLQMFAPVPIEVQMQMQMEMQMQMQMPDAPPPFHKRHRPDFELPPYYAEPIPQAYLNDIYAGPVKTYKQYLEFLGDDVTPEESKTLYEQYKREVQRRDCRHYFDETKMQEWFRDLYDPAAISQLRDDKNVRLLKKQQSFLDLFSKQSLVVPNLDNDFFTPNEFWTTEGFDKPEFSKTENIGIETRDPTYSDGNESAPTARKPKGFWFFETNTVFVKKITTKITRDDLKTAFGKYGTITKIFISPPLREQGFARMAWITFEKKENAQEAIKKLQRFKVHDCELLLSVSQHPNRAPHQVPASFSLQPSLESDYQVSRRLVEAFDAERKFDGPNPIIAESNKSIRQALDLNIYYLRNVHLFCFYCGEEFDDEIEMSKRCGTIHIRGSHSKIDDPTLCEWRRQHEMRVMSRLNNPSGRYRFIFSAEDKAIEEFCDQNTIYVGAERFRCSICPKKVFKAPEFVRKHLTLKHADLVEERRAMARSQQFMQSFLDDAERPCPAPDNTPTGPSAGASAQTHAIVPTSSLAHPARAASAQVPSMPGQGAPNVADGWIRPGSVESFNAVLPSVFQEMRERINYEDLAPIIGDPRSYYRTTFFT